jgi:hypothetical protein
MEKVFVTPELAAEWLRLVPMRQRSRRAKKVLKYARDMSEGKWTFSPAHTPLAFNTRGEMIQGQHRLAAVVMSGHGQWFHVVRDVEDAVVATLDTGISRSGADVLTMNGYLNGRNVATGAGLYCWLVNDFKGVASDMLTESELLEFVGEYNTTLQTAVQVATRISKMTGASHGALTASLFAFRVEGCDVFDLAQFEDVLQTGTSRVDGHPAKHLFSKFLAMNRSGRDKSGNKGHGVRRETILLTFKAWNNFMEGNPRTFRAPTRLPKVRTQSVPDNPLIVRL